VNELSVRLGDMLCKANSMNEWIWKFTDR